MQYKRKLDRQTDRQIHTQVYVQPINQITKQVTWVITCVVAIFSWILWSILPRTFDHYSRPGQCVRFWHRGRHCTPSAGSPSLGSAIFSKVYRWCFEVCNQPTPVGSLKPSSIFSRSEGPDEPVPVLSVPGRRDVRRLQLSGRLPLPGPCLQAGPPDVVEVVGA